MTDLSVLAGQTLPAATARGLGSATLLFSGTLSIPSGSGTTTVVTTLATLIDSDEIDYSITSGVITMTDGGLFLVSIVGVYASSANAGTRLICARGSTFGSSRLAPAAYSPAQNDTAGFGFHPAGAIPIEIQPGETVDVVGRQVSGASLSVTAYLGLTRLPTFT